MSKFYIPFFAILPFFMGSCYGPLEFTRGDFKDTILTITERYDDGWIKSQKKIEYPSDRKAIVITQEFQPFNPLAPVDSTGPDSVIEAEYTDKQFYVDTDIYTQRRKFESFHDGVKITKEKTRKRSKFRDGCEIVVSQKTKIYNQYGDVVYKEFLNFLWWRQTRLIYDESGGKLQSRNVNWKFVPKFRNYP